MTREDFERRLESAEKKMLGLQDEINNLKGKLAEMENSGDIPEFPVFERGSHYYAVNEEFKIKHDFHSGYKGTNHEEDDDLYNTFHTKEMAQEFADKCKLIAMMLHCKWYIDRDYKPDWSDGGFKHFVYYDNSQNKFVNDYVTSLNVGAVFFSTEEPAKKCADWLNERMEKDD